MSKEEESTVSGKIVKNEQTTQSAIGEQQESVQH